MSDRPPSRDPIKTYQRDAAARRRVSPGARCACGETRPRTFIPGSEPLICAKCDRMRHGKSLNDNHHPAGEANSPVTLPIPVNDHRSILNVAQYDWPRLTLENPDGNSYRRMAANIRGYVDTQRYLSDTLLFSVIEELEALAEIVEQTRQNNPKE